MLEINISKETDLNYRRKVAWLRSNRKYFLSEGVSISLPASFLEGEVRHNIQKVITELKTQGYDAVILGSRYETEIQASQFGSWVFEAFAKEGLSLVLKLKFEGAIKEALTTRDYLLCSDRRSLLISKLEPITHYPFRGIYWETPPFSSAILHDPRFRKWTKQELLTEEIHLFEEVFKELPVLINESSEPFFPSDTNRTIAALSSTVGKPWEDFLPENPLLKSFPSGYHPIMLMHNRGLLFMGEGLWPIPYVPYPKNTPSLYWGDCDHFGQFPLQQANQRDRGTLELEARLLWLKMRRAEGKPISKVQFEAWSSHLRELELYKEKTPDLHHFIADAWGYLYSLQGQPLPQGISQGGFWRGRSLFEEPSL